MTKTKSAVNESTEKKRAEKKPAVKRSPVAARPGAADETAAAYAKVERELDLLAPEAIGRITADVPTAVSLALGALPGLEALVPALRAALKSPPLESIARLRERALALLHAHLRFVPRTSKSLDADLEEARVLRERLLAAADAHVSFGQMDGEAVARIRDGKGHLDRANDVIALAALLRVVWPEIEGKTQVTPEQIERASALGTLLVAELGGKSLGTGPATGGKTWADRRLRAFRLFMNDYEEIRRAVEYLRYHEGDAGSFVPNLRPRSRSTEPEEPVVEEPPVEEPAAPSA